jgi:hypothetical protein
VTGRADAADASDRVDSVHRALELIPVRQMFLAEADAESVAAAMGVSVQRVRQIRDSGLRRMAEVMA